VSTISKPLLKQVKHVLSSWQVAQKLGQGMQVLFRLYVPVEQLIASTHSPFKRIYLEEHEQTPELNVNDDLQEVHNPVVFEHREQFAGQGLHILSALLKNSFVRHGVHHPVELVMPLQTHLPLMN
jgi:hypothetical protein